MIERFECPVSWDENTKIEKLDQGIFLEVISQESGVVLKEEACVYGSFHPEVNPWESFYRQAVDAGVICSDGCIVWDELICFCDECGGSAESLQELTLSDLTNMLENGETVLCHLNDYVLADVQAAALPGITGNTLVWVAGVDISDLDDASVAIGTSRGSVETVPMRNFMKAWKTSRNRAMVIQMG